MFGLYKSQVDADFGLYKSTRDGFDITNARISDLETKIAVLTATRPYQDALIQSDIRRVAEHADFNLFRRTCRMITGELVLPNEPLLRVILLIALAVRLLLLLLLLLSNSAVMLPLRGNYFGLRFKVVLLFKQ